MPKRKDQLRFIVHFKKIKELSLLGSRDIIFAKNKEIAGRKFKRGFPVFPKPKITSIRLI